MSAPQVVVHGGVRVVRDDLFPGGTKARYIGTLFDGADELVYASPAEGGAQFALAVCARQKQKRATIFVAGRKTPHDRAFEAKALGARVMQVRPGYLNVVQARARDYCNRTGATLVPFGVAVPGATQAIAAAATATSLSPDEVWCAAGSGLLARGLGAAWPSAKLHVVQVGRELKPGDIPAGAVVHKAPLPFSRPHRSAPPFPADKHYEAKAWETCVHRHGSGMVVFWNVAGPPLQQGQINHQGEMAQAAG